MHGCRRAFTVVELLVVIAIICLLAAILFPVLAGAKRSAYKASSLSNLRQIGLANLEYASDSDEVFPLAFGFSGDARTGKWLWNLSLPLVQDPTSDQACAFLYSLKPYGAGLEIYELPGAPHVKVGAATTERASGLTYNGLLHAFPTSGVVSPSKLPLFWAGLGNANAVGSGTANPVLTCYLPLNIGGPCHYQPGAPSQLTSVQGGGMFATLGPVWIYSKFAPFLYCDGSAKAAPLGAQISPAVTNEQIDPYYEYSAEGFPNRFWWDGFYPWLFRPDYDFQSKS